MTYDRSFVPASKNICFNYLQTDVFYNEEKGVKLDYIDRYFDGKDKLFENFENEKYKFSPTSGGDDYQIFIDVPDATNTFKSNYKSIKYFASNVWFDNFLTTENEVNDIDKVSFWFVRETTTKWVNGKCNVKFDLQIDIWATFGHLLKQLKGNFHFKAMMEDRYVKQNIGDTEAYVPDILNNKGHLNCSPFCKDINNKVLTKLNVLENKTSSTDYRNIGLIYYTFSEEKVSKLSNETIIQLSGDNENRIIQPYGIAIVNKPEQISDDGSNMFSAIKTMQKLDCKVLNFEYQTLNWTVLKNYIKKLNKDDDDDNAVVWLFKNVKNSDNEEKGGIIGIINQNIVIEQKIYKNIDFMYNKLENILSDEIKWENEPHCYMSNHTEIRLSIPEKNPYIIDYSILFLNGSPLIVFNNEVSITSTQINFFDAENGGKIIYLDNTSSNIYASISNARTYLDVQGSNNFQYKTSEYLDNMITRKNQKQASYDNIDIQRETAEYVKGQNYAYNSTATIADGAAAASGASTWNPFQWGSSAVKAGAATAKGIARTITQANIEQAQLKAQEKMARNTTDAIYADLANSPANIKSTGKISGQSTMLKQLLTKNNADKRLVYSIDWYKNQINEYNLNQIAYNRNRYGSVLDIYKQINSFEELLTRSLWNYIEIENIREFTKSWNYDWNIIEHFNLMFETGITIHNSDRFSEFEEYYIDYNKNNIEKKILETLGLDTELDTYML